MPLTARFAMALAAPRTLPRASAETLGEWELAQLAGRGEFATVYRARPLRRAGAAGDYAIKIARTDRSDRAACAALLACEAAVAAQVVHPHLIAVLVARCDHERPHLALPWLEGATLAARLAAGQRFAVPVALAIARQVAGALAALAEHHYRHGDVKPSNILLSPNGHATLLDLGFACHRDDDATRDQRLWLGTPRYAAPERFTSRLTVTPQSDIYSLGVVLHVLLTGGHPSDSWDERRVSVAPRPPSPSKGEGRGEGEAPIAPEITALLKTLLAQDPLRRPTACELVDTLARLEILHFTDRAAKQRTSRH